MSTIAESGASTETVVDPHELYRTRIEPAILPLEEERLRILRRRTTTLVAILGGTAVLVLILLLSGAAFAIWLIAGVFGGIVALIVWSSIGRDFLRQVREMVVTPIASALGVSHSVDGSGFSMAGFREAGVVGAHNRSTFGDHVRGRHRDTEFSMVGATLKMRRSSGKNSSTTTVFKGLLFRIHVPIAFQGRTLIARDHGQIGNALHSLGKRFTNLRPVQMPFEDFEALYEVFTDTPEEARRLIGRAFADSMLALAASHEGRGLTAAFVDGEFLLAVPASRNLFSVGGLGTPMSGIAAEIEQIVSDLQIPHRVIDHLHGQSGGRLVH